VKKPTKQMYRIFHDSVHIEYQANVSKVRPKMPAATGF
jgi:hypothetical protein